MTWYAANEEGITLSWIWETHLSLLPYPRTLSLKAQSWGRTCQNIFFPLVLWKSHRSVLSTSCFYCVACSLGHRYTCQVDFAMALFSLKKINGRRQLHPWVICGPTGLCTFSLPCHFLLLAQTDLLMKYWLCLQADIVIIRVSVLNKHERAGN